LIRPGTKKDRFKAAAVEDGGVPLPPSSAC